MKFKKFRCIISFLVICLLVLPHLVILGGCADNADMVFFTEETTIPLYETVIAMLDNFHQENEEIISGNSDAAQYINIVKEAQTTPQGNTCASNYIETVDNKFASLVLTIPSENNFRIDTYWRINPSVMYIDSIKKDVNDTVISEIKYVVIDDIMYTLNIKENKLEITDKPDSLDLYLSFEEIYNLYGSDK